MGPQQRLWTAYALTDAAAYASGQHGLAHHDLHPQNILFQTTSDGTWDVPKIVDWGLSRELIQHTGSVSQTTPKYAAPEQFDALMPQVSVGPHTDVYQLGVVCYELLTGHYPSHLHGDIPKASDRNPTLPEAIDDILTQALAHDRRHRYDHPIEVRNALENILSTCGQSSTPTEPTQVDRQVSTDDKCESDDCRIVIVGVGGAGNNTVTRLYNIGVEGAKTVAINTDRHHLEKVEADRKVLIGKSLTSGLGADGDPSKGKRASEMAQGTIKNVLEGANLVFITAGMGRGTGTGVSPVVARIADDMGAMVVAMVTRPFEDKRARVKKANDGITNLRKDADSVIISNNDKLLDYVPDLPIGKAFSVVDQIFAEALKCVSEAITQPSLVNLDYADMSTIMNQDGVTVMLVGETEDKNKTQEVVNDAMNPLLDVDYRGASGGLVHITGGPDLTQRRARGIAQNITERLEADTNVIWGAQIQEEYKGKVRIVAIMTGV
jgi:cell division protein FtsZ